jgi:hypothetical protein
MDKIIILNDKTLNQSNNKKLFLIIIFIFISIFIFQSNVYGLMFRPIYNSSDSIEVKKEYGWMIKTNKSYLSIYVCGTTSKFITENEVRRYIKLKMRSFIKDYKFIDIIPKGSDYSKDHTFTHCTTILLKYNDNLPIYYGLLTFSIVPVKNKNYQKYGSEYSFATPIAGSNDQIKNRLKEKIDKFIEEFAEDYYYMKDLK